MRVLVSINEFFLETEEQSVGQQTANHLRQQQRPLHRLHFSLARLVQIAGSSQGN
jgi:hypothetical protein